MIQHWSYIPYCILECTANFYHAVTRSRWKECPNGREPCINFPCVPHVHIINSIIVELHTRACPHPCKRRYDSRYAKTRPPVAPTCCTRQGYLDDELMIERLLRAHVVRFGSNSSQCPWSSRPLSLPAVEFRLSAVGIACDSTHRRSHGDSWLSRFSSMRALARCSSLASPDSGQGQSRICHLSLCAARCTVCLTST
jgi:hypothetical protein